MLLIPSYVAPSTIEGVGVFASEAIPAGALIWKLDPGFDRLIRHDEIAGLPATFRTFAERYGYPYPHDPSLTVLELDNGRFMNHSTAPNTCFADPDAGYAVRRIEAGEEMTCDYSEFDPAFEMLPGRRFAPPVPGSGPKPQPSA
ncbi:MAG: protein-lysine N-methyltransferase [Alphaproteobacteria bacterium]|nr:protein-lysine N-methyltransferase [Alphaproteobacteria bacterium]